MFIVPCHPTTWRLRTIQDGTCPNQEPWHTLVGQLYRCLGGESEVRVVVGTCFVFPVIYEVPNTSTRDLDLYNLVETVAPPKFGEDLLALSTTGRSPRTTHKVLPWRPNVKGAGDQQGSMSPGPARGGGPRLLSRRRLHLRCLPHHSAGPDRPRRRSSDVDGRRLHHFAEPGNGRWLVRTILLILRLPVTMGTSKLVMPTAMKPGSWRVE